MSNEIFAGRRSPLRPLVPRSPLLLDSYAVIDSGRGILSVLYQFS